MGGLSILARMVDLDDLGIVSSRVSNIKCRCVINYVPVDDEPHSCAVGSCWVLSSLRCRSVTTTDNVSFIFNLWKTTANLVTSHYLGLDTPFVDQVFGHDMNLYSLWLKMFVIKFTCRSFSFMSRQVFKNKKWKSHSCVFRRVALILCTCYQLLSPETKIIFMALFDSFLKIKTAPKKVIF